MKTSELVTVTVMGHLYGALMFYVRPYHCLDDALELARCLREDSVFYLHAPGEKREWYYDVRGGYNQGGLVP